MRKHWKLKRQAVVSETNCKNPARYILWALQKCLRFWELTRTRNDLWTCKWTIWDSALINNLFQYHLTFFFLCYLCELARSHRISHKILPLLLPLSCALPPANSHGCFQHKDVGFRLPLRSDHTSRVKFTAIKMDIYVRVTSPTVNNNSSKSYCTCIRLLQMFAGKSEAIKQLHSHLASGSRL